MQGLPQFSRKRLQYVVVVALALPLFLGIIAAFWGRVQTPYRIWFGVIPWLEARPEGLQPIPDAWTYHVHVGGLFWLVPVTLVIISALLVLLRTVVRLADLHGRCIRCGYRIAKETCRCPECGSEIQAIVEARRRPYFGRIHRPLILAMAFLWTVPGLLILIALIARWRYTPAITMLGQGSEVELRITTYLLSLNFVSLAAGIWLLIRYIRSLEFSRSELLQALSIRINRHGGSE